MTIGKLPRAITMKIKAIVRARIVQRIALILAFIFVFLQSLQQHFLTGRPLTLQNCIMVIVVHFSMTQVFVQRFPISSLRLWQKAKLIVEVFVTGTYFAITFTHISSKLF
jgi:hypothetical protein